MAVKEKDTEAVAVSEEKNKALKLAIEKSKRFRQRFYYETG